MRLMKKIYLLLFVLSLGSCRGASDASSSSTTSSDATSEEAVVGHVSTDTTANLIAYYFDHAKYDLRFECAPSSEDTSILTIAEAAFTHHLLDTFSHVNIMGPHVSDGVLYDGYEYDEGRYGLFAAIDTSWTFSSLPADSLLNEVVGRHGMAFVQHWIIRDATIYPYQIQQDGTVNTYRAIAEKDGRLCLIDSRRDMEYGLFKAALMAYGVENALYMDMGAGWNYSFYRDANDSIHVLHSLSPSPYCTNWLVVLK